MNGAPLTAAGDRPGEEPSPDRGPALRLTVLPSADGGADLHVELDRPRCGPVTIRLTCARTGEEAVARLSCAGPAPAGPGRDGTRDGARDDRAIPAAPGPGAAAEPGDRTAPPPGEHAPPVPGPTAAQVRAWARRQGMSVADVGRIPTEIVDEYLAATAATAAGTAAPAPDATQDQRPK